MPGPSYPTGRRTPNGCWPRQPPAGPTSTPTSPSSGVPCTAPARHRRCCRRAATPPCSWSDRAVVAAWPACCSARSATGCSATRTARSPSSTRGARHDYREHPSPNGTAVGRRDLERAAPGRDGRRERAVDPQHPAVALARQHRRPRPVGRPGPAADGRRPGRADADDQLRRCTAPRAWRAELDRWIDSGASDTGVPVVNIPGQPVRTPVPERDFGRPGTLPMRGSAAGAAVYAVLYGEEDDPAAWLSAGRALSAVWLMANELDVSVVPISAITEVPGTRRGLRELLARIGWPYLVLRMGLTDPRSRGPRVTPRLPAEETVR